MIALVANALLHLGTAERRLDTLPMYAMHKQEIALTLKRGTAPLNFEGINKIFFKSLSTHSLPAHL